jgi:diacylglycerol kinase
VEKEVLEARENNMKKYLLKILKSTRFGLRGLRHAYRYDQSFRMETAGALGYFAVILLVWPLNQIEWLFLILSYCLILITELINTSVEHMLSKIHPEEHETIGRSKDITSSAVLLAFVFAFCVVVSLIWNRYF